MGVNRHLQVLAGGPNRVVAPLVIARAFVPHGGNEDAAPQPRFPSSCNLGHRGVHVVDDRHNRHPGPPLGTVVAQIGQPPVMGPSPGQQQLGVFGERHSQTGPERCRSAAGDRIGIGEYHLSGDAITV